MIRFLMNLDRRTAGIWGVIVLAAFVAWLLYPKPSRQARKEGVTEIVFWNTMDPFYSEAIKPVVAEFEARNPQYRVLMGAATVKSEIGDPTRFLMSVAGGSPPDVLMFDRFAVVEWGSRGAFTDLTPYIERDRNLPGAIREENFYPAAWREPNYHGKNFAIANGIDTRALFYNEDLLLRAGLVWGASEPEVLAGKAKAGDARPPKTWEEVCLKRLHANGEVSADGQVKLVDLVRRPAVNEDKPKDARPDLQEAGVRAGDVVTLRSGMHVWRGRILSVQGPDRFQIDLARDQRPGLKGIPGEVTGRVEVKVIDQDSYTARLARFDASTGKLISLAMAPTMTDQNSVAGASSNSFFYMFSWLNGGALMNEDGDRCTMDSQANSTLR